jgi:hypothetical protein
MNDSRQKMLDRVRAILAKTMDNGCTEGEAMAALQKARELMAAYEISEAELNVTQEQEKATVRKDERPDPYDIKRWLARGVGRFTRCRHWSGKNAGYAVGFAGLESDVIFANWLLDTLQAFVLRELKAFQASRRKEGLNNPRIIGASFVHGCCERISARLIELVPDQPIATSDTANALTVSRKALITQAMADAGISLTKSRKRSLNLHGGAYYAGNAAGNAARFDRPVTAGGTLRLT